MMPGETGAGAGDRKRDVFVFGVGRSGTTWLAEIIAAEGLELIFEPLNPKHVPECRDWGPLPLYYGAADVFPWQETFDAMVRGEVRNDWTIRKNPGAERKVVKFIRANLMIEWILEHYDVYPVFIIRSPLAVAASMKQQGWQVSPKWIGSLLRDPRFEELFSDSPEIHRMADRKLSRIEARAAFWSILNYVPMCLGVLDRLHVVSYEDLCLDPERAVSKLAPSIEIAMTDEVREQLRAKSFMSGPESDGRGYDPTTAWSKTLSTGESDAVREVVTAFGLDRFLDPLFSDAEHQSGGRSEDSRETGID